MPAPGQRPDGEGSGVFEPPPEWMQPNSLSLDPSFRFSVAWQSAPEVGNLRCSADVPVWLSAQPRVALTRTSRRLARPLSSLAAPRWPDDFPCKSARPSLRALRSLGRILHLRQPDLDDEACRARQLIADADALDHVPGGTSTAMWTTLVPAAFGDRGAILTRAAHKLCLA